MLDTWALRVLLEVADRGSLTAAAAALSMTQPAVSRQIAGLERTLGVRLFDRVPRGVRLTPAGRSAIPLAREIDRRIRDLETTVRAHGSGVTGRVRLAGFPSVNAWFVPEVIDRFARSHPDVEVTLCAADAVTAVRAVQEERLDLALVTSWDRPTDGVELVPVLREELHVALPADHPLAGRGHVALPDLVDETWIEGAHPDCLGPISQLARGIGASPRIGFACDDWNAKQGLVARGLGVTLVPATSRATVRPDVVVRPIVPAVPHRLVLAAVPQVARRPGAAAAMLGLMIARSVEGGPAGPGGWAFPG